MQATPQQGMLRQVISRKHPALSVDRHATTASAAQAAERSEATPLVPCLYRSGAMHMR